LGKTNGTSEGLKNRFSCSGLEGSEHAIHGGLGVMAVQGFSRIRTSCFRTCVPLYDLDSGVGGEAREKPVQRVCEAPTVGGGKRGRPALHGAGRAQLVQ